MTLFQEFSMYLLVIARNTYMYLLNLVVPRLTSTNIYTNIDLYYMQQAANID